jgi:hypothetical protein
VVQHGASGTGVPGTRWWWGHGRSGFPFVPTIRLRLTINNNNNNNNNKNKNMREAATSSNKQQQQAATSSNKQQQATTINPDLCSELKLILCTYNIF